MIQNLELNIFLTSKATPANAQAYCDRLMKELDKQHVIRFEKTNVHIRSDYDLGVIVDSPNKVKSGEWHIKFKLDADLKEDPIEIQQFEPT